MNAWVDDEDMWAAVCLFALATAEQLYQQGVESWKAGRHAEAAAALSQAAAAEPRDAQIWKVLGIVHASQADYEAANTPFERACTLRPNLADACYYYARNLYALNRFTPSLEALRKVPSEERNSTRVRLAFAQALEALDRPGESEKEYLAAIRALGQGPKVSPDLDPRLHYAVFLFRQGRGKDALAPARAVVEAHPGSGRARFELGRILANDDDLQGAAAELAHAVEFGYGTPAHLLLGKVYARLGRLEESQKHLAAARAATAQ